MRCRDATRQLDIIDYSAELPGGLSLCVLALRDRSRATVEELLYLYVLGPEGSQLSRNWQQVSLSVQP